MRTRTTPYERESKADEESRRGLPGARGTVPREGSQDVQRTKLLQSQAGNQAVSGLLSAHTGNRGGSIMRSTDLQVQREGPTSYLPPPGAATGRLPGRVGVEDVGGVGALHTTIMNLLPSAMKSAGRQGKANVDATYNHDVVMSQIVNMTNGSPLSTQITGRNGMQDYVGDVSVTAQAKNFQFVTATGPGLSGTSSSSSSGATGQSSTTTGLESSAGMSAGGHEGALGGEASIGMNGSDTAGGSATMAGTVTRGTGSTPESVQFTCDFEYRITVRYSRSARTGWSIATLGLANLIDAVREEEHLLVGVARGTGARVGFATSACIGVE